MLLPYFMIGLPQFFEPNYNEKDFFYVTCDKHFLIFKKIRIIMFFAILYFMLSILKTSEMAAVGWKWKGQIIISNTQNLGHMCFIHVFEDNCRLIRTAT